MWKPPTPLWKAVNDLISIYRVQGVPSHGLHLTLHFSSSHRVLLCWQKRWRATTIYRLQRTECLDSPIPLPSPTDTSSLRTTQRGSNIHKTRSMQHLQSYKEGDEWKTAFHTTTGHYEYLVIPYGLTNAPAVFQTYINEIFRDVLHSYVIKYIDDILIYSSSYEEHVHHVCTVLVGLKSVCFTKTP